MKAAAGLCHSRRLLRILQLSAEASQAARLLVVVVWQETWKDPQLPHSFRSWGQGCHCQLSAEGLQAESLPVVVGWETL